DQSATLVVAASWVQVAPPSLLLKTPPPVVPPPLIWSPVPAYILLESTGLIISVLTTMFAIKSLTGSQETPPLLLFQMPPPAVPSQICPLGANWGWKTIAFTAPPILPGPIHVQLSREMPAPAGRTPLWALRIRAIWARARIRPSAGMTPCSSCSNACQ